MMMRVMTVAGLMALAGCRCTPGLVRVEPAQLVATPMQLVLAPTYVGQQAVGVVSVVNEGGAKAVADVSVSAPFTVDVGHLELVRGESAALTVAFAPTQAGHASAVLLVGNLEVQVEADGLEVPACLPSTVCVDAHFEPGAAQCQEAPRPDGTPCETSCVTGACTAGTCLGTLRGCTGGTACTVAACDEATGCSYLPRTCPAPTAPCQVAKCDSVTGCGTEVVPDGTLCGPDDCLATQVQVCIVGQCVARTRPDTGRCANTWVPVSIPARSFSGMAYDEARQRLVIFGGQTSGQVSLADTWEWDGTAWLLRTPASSPPARFGHALTYDARRRRIVLFGGTTGSGALSDTWEWDGTTWVQRAPASSPPPRRGHAMAYDLARQRLVLFGGHDGAGGYGTLSDTWTWDGTTWTQQAPATSPSSRNGHALAYDLARQRVVLFGGFAGITHSDTWEWDGATWVQRSPASAPPARSDHALAWDAARQRLVLFGGHDAYPAPPLADTWEWDGTTWVLQRSTLAPAARVGHALAWDAGRQSVVLFGGYDGNSLADSWSWEAPMGGGVASWVLRSQVSAPSARDEHAMTYDAARQRLVLFGGMSPTYDSLSDTWEWDGATWAQRTPAISPPVRRAHALAYDVSRQRVVLFGGWGSPNANLSDTWEWDGSSWLLRTPATSPPGRSGHSLAYDAVRRRVVLVGGWSTATGLRLADTWEWDGTTWVAASVAMASPEGGAALAYDAARQRVVASGVGASTTFTTWEWDGVAWVLRAPATSPSGRNRHAVAYDELRQRLLLFGGGDPLTGGPLADTWEWDGTTWLERTPARSPPALWSHALAWDAARQRVVNFDRSGTWLFLP